MKARKILYLLLTTLFVCIPLTSVKAETTCYFEEVKNHNNNDIAKEFLNKITNISFLVKDNVNNMMINYSTDGSVFNEKGNIKDDSSEIAGIKYLPFNKTYPLKNAELDFYFNSSDGITSEHQLFFSNFSGKSDYDDYDYIQSNCGKKIFIDFVEAKKGSGKTIYKYNIHFESSYVKGELQSEDRDLCTFNNVQKMDSDEFINSITSIKLVKNTNNNDNITIYGKYETKQLLYIDDKPYNTFKINTSTGKKITMKYPGSGDKVTMEIINCTNSTFIAFADNANCSATAIIRKKNNKTYQTYIVSSDNPGEQYAVCVKKEGGLSKKKAKSQGDELNKMINTSTGSNYSDVSISVFDTIDIDFCSEEGVQTVFYVMGVILNVIKILVPILLIIFGTIDFSKAVILNDDKAINTAVITFAKRIISGIIIFFVPTIIYYVTSLIGNAVSKDDPEFIKCTACLLRTKDCEVRPSNSNDNKENKSSNYDFENECAVSLTECSNNPNCEVYNGICRKVCSVIGINECDNYSYCHVGSKGTCEKK